MNKKYLYIFIIVFIVLWLFQATAKEASLDFESLYEEAKNYVAFGAYQDALSCFEEIPRYDDSTYWQAYCKAMICISRANDLEHGGYIAEAKEEIANAKQCLGPLLNAAFEDSEKLYEYCIVRNNELCGLIQQAIDGYSNVYGILDSADRYQRLLQGVPLPTQAPNQASLPPMLAAYPYHANRALIPTAGPGSAYAEIDGLSIEADSEVWVCAVEDAPNGAYYMAEADTEQGKVRFWAVCFRLNPADDGVAYSLPEIGVNRQNLFLLEDAEALFGPGEGYRNSGLTVPAGTKVTTLGEEDAYTMIEYTPSREAGPMRVWVQTGKLSR